MKDFTLREVLDVAYSKYERQGKLDSSTVEKFHDLDYEFDERPYVQYFWYDKEDPKYCEWLTVYPADGKNYVGYWVVFNAQV